MCKIACAIYYWYNQDNFKPWKLQEVDDVPEVVLTEPDIYIDPNVLVIT